MSKITEIRKLFEYYVEGDDFVNNQSTLSYVPAGYVEYEDSAVLKTIPLVITSKDYKGSSSLVRTDSDELLIAVTYYDFIQDDSRIFYAVIAHELGHLLSGHMEDKKNKIHTTVNKDKVAYLYNKALNNDKYNNRYLRAVVSSILKGGMLELELEADIKASEYVPPSHLALIHSECTLEKSKLAIKEKENRVKYWLFKDKEHKDLNKQYKHLEVVLKRTSS